MPYNRTVFLVAGGTGGHVFPALALAQELIARGINVECITDKRGEKYFRNTRLVPHIVKSSAWATDWQGKLKAGWQIAQGIIHSFEMIREHSPFCVVGFGGYPSFPTVKAAQLLKIPTILHEQNAVFGRANRQVAKLAQHIATSFENTKMIADEDKKKVIVTGNPVRPNFLENYKPYKAPSEGKRLNLLVFAGSQGSSLFSKVLPAAIALLSDDLKARLRLVQQTRFEDVDMVSKAYVDMNVKANVQPFFTEILELYQKSHLVIARAGASTIAEITSLGQPTIFIPLASSLDGDQAQNAEQLVAKEAGWMIAEKNFTPEVLAAKLTEILNDPAKLASVAEAAQSLGKPEAANLLADLVTKIN